MYRIQIHGDPTPVLDTENPGDVVGWLTDAKFQIRGASSMNPADGSTTLRTRATTDAEWLPIITWPQEVNLPNNRIHSFVVKVQQRCLLCTAYFMPSSWYPEGITFGCHPWGRTM